MYSLLKFPLSRASIRNSAAIFPPSIAWWIPSPVIGSIIPSRHQPNGLPTPQYADKQRVTSSVSHNQHVVTVGEWFSSQPKTSWVDRQTQYSRIPSDDMVTTRINGLCGSIGNISIWRFRIGWRGQMWFGLKYLNMFLKLKLKYLTWFWVAVGN